MLGAEEDQVVIGLGDQGRAPQDEGAQEDLAQLGIALCHGAEAVGVQSDDRPAGGDAAAGPGYPRREHVDLARELARPEHRDRFFATGDRAQEIDPAADHDVHVGMLVAGLEQDLSGPDAAALADARNARELGIVEAGEELLFAGHVPRWGSPPPAPRQSCCYPPAESAYFLARPGGARPPST